MSLSEWRHGLEPVAVQQVHQVIEDARASDGVGAIGGHVVDALGSERHRYLLADVDGRTVGVTVIDGEDPAEVVVHPEFRLRGIGRELVAAAIGDAGRAWAHGNLPGAVAVAERLGLLTTRTLLQLRRSLPVPADVRPGSALPQGVSIRTFVPGQDDEQFLAVNARAFAWHPEQGRLDAAGLAGEMAQDWFDPAGFFLAVTDDPAYPEGRVLGFHWTKVHPSDPTPSAAEVSASTTAPDRAPGPVGEVYVIGVDPDAGVRGLGGPLTAAGLDHLAEAGLTTVLLYVEGDNDRALKLYRRFGFEVAVTDVVYARPAAPPVVDTESLAPASSSIR